ncbi:response regulator [Vibrio campbellii]|uniref:ATP-binding protein n=1 Tax=Vibrio campbellii TaxID=680 RepID=UPI000EFA53A3|nr:transporter substrate-binding domain-containing protein [Vibrio campbellii]AYO11562.1 response regulator [Vibrio campbellii]
MKLFASIAALLITFSFSALAEDFLSKNDRLFLDNQKSVKVGVLAGDWLPYWGNLESKEGINIEYAESMLHDLHIDAEYVPYYSLDTLFNGLENGEIDLTVGFVATQKRAERFLFSEPIFQTLRLVWLRDVALENTPLSELKWVCVKDSSACDQIETLGFEHVHTVRNSVMMTTSLNTGAADAAVVGLSTLSSYGFKNPHGELTGKVVYDKALTPGAVTIFTGKESQQLMGIINKYIKHSKDSKHSRMHIEANINVLHNELMLEILEQQNGRQTVRYTIKNNVYPLSYTDPKTKEVKGYVHDLMKLLEQKSMLKFEYIHPNGRDVDLMLQEHIVDVLPTRNIAITDKKRFIATRSFGVLQYGYIESLNKQAQKSVGILDRAGNFYPHFLDNPAYASSPVYRDFKSLSKALEDGKISHAFVNQNLIDHHFYKGQGTQFKAVAPPDDMELGVALGMELRKDSEFLHRVLDTVLQVTTKEELQQLKERHEKVTVNYGIEKEIVVISALAGVCILLIAVLIYIVRTGHLTRTIKRKEYETQIRQKQNKWLSSVLDQLPNKILISDENNKQILANKPFINMLSRCNVDKGITDQEREQVLDLTRECVSSDSESTETSLCSLGDKHYRVRQQTLLHPEEGTQYRMTVFDDISELKQKETALKASNLKAMQAIEAREHFLAVVSHELRTPIAAMMGLMELLEQDVERKESKELLKSAMQSAERLQLQVNDILDFSKIDANQLQLDVHKGNVYQELGATLRSFEKIIERKSLAFELNWTPTPHALVVLDWLRVSQIINNLLSNAVKFTEEGKVIVSVHVSPSQLEFKVQDTGCGMNNAQLATLFQPFVQGDKSTSRRFGGTGLGMSIVKSLVDIMEGTIEVDSQTEQGTTITVRLPMISQPLDMTALVPVYTEDKQVQRWLNTWQVTLDEFESKHHVLELEPHYSNVYPDLILQKLNGEVITQTHSTQTVEYQWDGRVLVVDDDAINRLLFKRQFEKLGVNCQLVASGLEAIEALEQAQSDNVLAPFNLVITDCHMPDMDGYQLTQALKANKVLASIPVVTCTAENSRNVIEKAEQSGIETVLFKPYSLSELQALCEQYLSRVINAESQEDWLEAYSYEERLEMAQVICEALNNDIALIHSGEESLKSVAHRIKGSAAALNLTQLGHVAMQCESLVGSEQEVQARTALISELETIVSTTQQWLNMNESN